MDPLVRSALGIGDAPWPPDYATLLGLDPAKASADAVEAAVLERMERVRQYQIRLPEPVTEAMNLLARALDDLTAFPAAAPLPATEEGAPAGVDAPLEASPSFQPVPPSASADAGIGVFAPPPPPKVFASTARRVRTPRRAVLPSLKRYVESVPWQEPLDPHRRRVYDLVRCYRLQDTWEQIGLLWTGQRLDRGDLIAVVIALRRVNGLAESMPKGVGQAILAWARTHPGTQALVDLTASRRRMLAADWQTALEPIRDHCASARAASIWRRRWRRHGVYWIAAGFLIAAMLMALLRSLPRD